MTYSWWSLSICFVVLSRKNAYIKFWIFCNISSYIPEQHWYSIYSANYGYSGFFQLDLNFDKSSKKHIKVYTIPTEIFNDKWNEFAVEYFDDFSFVCDHFWSGEAVKHRKCPLEIKDPIYNTLPTYVIVLPQLQQHTQIFTLALFMFITFMTSDVRIKFWFTRKYDILFSCIIIIFKFQSSNAV